MRLVRHPQFRSESGQTIALVAISLLALLALAALAIDLTTLYVARSEAQRAADAAALAGAKIFVTSGFTSGMFGSTSSGTAQDVVCNSPAPPVGNTVGTAMAEQQAQAVAQQNTIAGVNAVVLGTACDFSNGGGQNPQFTVSVQRTALPTFFGRIWGIVPASVSATATAEAYNPSGYTVPIQVGSLKPWGIMNCDPYNTGSGTNPNCLSSPPGSSSGYFVDPTTYAIANPDTVVGEVFDLSEGSSSSHPTATAGSPAQTQFLALDIQPASASALYCPSPGAPWGTCSSVFSGATPSYTDTISCSSSVTYKCGDTLNVDPSSGSGLTTPSSVNCLIHATTRGYSPTGHGQDLFCGNAVVPICTHGTPMTIAGGSQNPDTSLQGATNISRSDSVVNVPIWQPCPVGGPCGSTVTIIGFLQLGVTRFRGSPNNSIRAVVLNVAGCGSASGSAGASGGGVAPIPVRLVTPAPLGG